MGSSNVFAILTGNQQEDLVGVFLEEIAGRGKTGGVVSSPSLALNEYPILERQRPQ